MSKKFYLISLLFYFCALFMSAQNSWYYSKMQMLYFGGGANQTKK